MDLKSAALGFSASGEKRKHCITKDSRATKGKNVIKLHCGEQRLHFAFNFNLRPYTMVSAMNMLHCKYPGMGPAYLAVYPEKLCWEGVHIFEGLWAGTLILCLYVAGGLFRTSTRPTMNFLLLPYSCPSSSSSSSSTASSSISSSSSSWEVVENSHSTDVEVPHVLTRVCMSILTQGNPFSDIGRVLILNDPGMWRPCT